MTPCTPTVIVPECGRVLVLVMLLEPHGCASGSIGDEDRIHPPRRRQRLTQLTAQVIDVFLKHAIHNQTPAPRRLSYAIYGMGRSSLGLPRSSSSCRCRTLDGGRSGTSAPDYPPRTYPPQLLIVLHLG